MGFSDLKWVYGPTHRARDVPNEAVDAYKRIIQQLYLDQNKTRAEVLDYLQDSHGFSLSINQFSKAMKRWGFYKQPRQVQQRIQPPGSITEEAEAPYPTNPPNSLIPLEELFDFEPDALDTIDETEVGFQTGRECATDPESHEQRSYSGRRFVSEVPPSTNHSEPQTVSDGFPCDTERSLHEISLSRLQTLETTKLYGAGPVHIRSETFVRASFENYINMSRVGYLTCCYLFEDAIYWLERSGKTLDKQENRVPRSNTDKLFPQHRRDKNKLSENPSNSLDMWSIIRLLEQTGEPDDLVDRLDTNDLLFMNAMRACLGLCKTWIELVGKGLPSGALQFDSLFLHQNVSKAVQNICRPLHQQGRYDIWKEAGFLFAFIWSNEKFSSNEKFWSNVKSNGANLRSWLDENEISGLSPTHFLAVICEMIVHITARSSPVFRNVSKTGNDGGEPICGLYLQTIDKIRISPARTVKKDFITYFFNRHAGLDSHPEENGNLESVQLYQRTAEKFVFKEQRDNLTQKLPQAIPLHGDFRINNLGSLASSRSTNSPSYSSRYLNHQQYLAILSSNPTMTRSLASGSSRGSSLNSFRAFQSASRAMEICLKEDQGEYT